MRIKLKRMKGEWGLKREVNEIRPQFAMKDRKVRRFMLAGAIRFKNMEIRPILTTPTTKAGSTTLYHTILYRASLVSR